MTTDARAEYKGRVALITGGGDCPGLNAVIRGVVHRMTREHRFEVIGSEDAFNGFFETPQRIHSLGLPQVSGILNRGGTILGTTNRGDPFAWGVQDADGQWRKSDRSAELVEKLRALECSGLICIGGDGTLKIGRRLMQEHGFPVIGVPKTIDNDVGSTDYTFGFQTAVQTATTCIDMLHSTAEAHDRIMVVEVMGRDAGHIALHSGLAGGADAILIPEIPYELDRVAETIVERRAHGRNFSIVVVAEGAAPKNGERATVELTEEEAASRMARLGGIGNRVAAGLTERTGMEARVTVLGHLQRGGSPVAFDRTLATAFGVKAADFAAEGNWGVMLALRTPDVIALPLGEVLAEYHRVDVGGPWVHAARGVGICLGDNPGS
jgi:6-phosphofructokinase 1